MIALYIITNVYIAAVIATAEDLTAAIRILQEQQQRDAQATLNTAINAKRDQLLAQL